MIKMSASLAASTTSVIATTFSGRVFPGRYLTFSCLNFQKILEAVLKIKINQNSFKVKDY